MGERTIQTWQGCYDDSWAQLIVPEAFAHPAKFARGLIERIFDTMLSEGMIAKGRICVDPFGGVGCGGVIAASKGIAWIGCELEARFVSLAKENFELHRRTWEAFGDPLPVIVQGDSRWLREVIGAADVCVSSPPVSAAS